jgi:redox-sensitive bicupin YhaK (pirin superfamily)
MPAVIPQDVLSLERVPKLDRAHLLERPVLSITSAPSGLEGEGFPVKRAFAGVSLERLDPFVHMDQMGAVDYAPGEPKGTPWHPHRGFETVTYMIDGVFQHQDSNGGGGVISNGDTQWMTAGSGILHIETPPEWLVEQGGLFHGIQLWVNLPRKLKMAPPRYQDIRGSEVALLTTPDGGGLVRIIAGELCGKKGPGITHTPITLAHVSLEPAARIELPWPREFNCLVYVLAGAGSITSQKVAIGAAQLAVMGAGDAVVAEASGSRGGSAVSGGAFSGMDLLVLGGKPIGEPVVHYGPFVMNTKEEIVQALEDYQAGRLGQIPAHSAEKVG